MAGKLRILNPATGLRNSEFIKCPTPTGKGEVSDEKIARFSLHIFNV
jgi:hypothetical protein